jgi:hypothetical protein
VDKRKDDDLDEQIPAYGLEALVSMIDDENALITALKAAGQRFSIFKRQLDAQTT